MRHVVACLVGVAIGVGVLLLGAGDATAAAVPVEGAKFSVEASIADNLKAYQGKRVILVLDSGKELGGTVKEVSGSHVHLEGLDGMDYFDGLIRTDRIVAVKARFRAPR
jgi:hypothetical protein